MEHTTHPMVSTSSAENSPVTAVNTSNASLSYHELDSLSMSTLGTPVGLHIPHWGSVQRKHNKWLTNIGLYYRPNVDYANSRILRRGATHPMSASVSTATQEGMESHTSKDSVESATKK
mmetsp:Transcript_27497/g.69348  ORF Transcript_27497/g.69348 Transcript_27497/m.69348 type:complete len:119 (+) Transcript_27497:374-730(+)|eukprot:g14341.t1